MPEYRLLKRLSESIPMVILLPALALSACSQAAPDPADILAKTEEAATRAEKAQKAAEAAAELARSKVNQIARANADAAEEAAQQQPSDSPPQDEGNSAMADNSGNQHGED